MQGEFYHPLGSTKWSTDAKGLTIRTATYRRSIRWAEVTRAGVFSSEQAQANLALYNSHPVFKVFHDNFLPGTGWLFRTSQRAMGNYRQLVLARGPSYNRALFVALPLFDPRADQLVEVTRQAVGERWMGVMYTQQEKKVMGLRYAFWFWPMIIVGACLGVVCMFTAVYPWMLMRDWDVVGLLHVPVWAWLALAAWCVLVGGLYWLFRNRV